MRQASNASQMYLKQIQVQHGPQTHWVQKLEQLQYIGQTPHKYVHIDMKLNFMHSHLGFDGVYPIY